MADPCGYAETGVFRVALIQVIHSHLSSDILMISRTGFICIYIIYNYIILLLCGIY